MGILEIIAKKRDKKSLTKKEINFLIDSYVKGEATDYQMSAFCMAVFINGMNKTEIFNLTKAIQNSGRTLDLSILGKNTVNKHSSGGVSDTTTIAIAPIIACAGVKMLKMSGRSLGHTGGTADKLESFTGYKTEIPIDMAIKLTKKNGACLISQSEELCKADKLLYNLRDVTATVESLPLIASSIMSKKLASGSKIIVLDVKCGDDGFMKTKNSAIELAKIMVEIGKKDNKKIVAFVTDMKQPLGTTIGDTLEVCEAIEVLKNKQNGNLAKLVKIISSEMIALAKNITIKKASKIVEDIITSGQALEKLKVMVKDSGGSLELFDGNLLTPADCIFAKQNGYISEINARRLGVISIDLGAGRKKLGDEIDHNVGFKLFVKIGDKIKKGQKICDIYLNKKLPINLKKDLESCFVYSNKKPKLPMLVKKIIK